MSEITVKLEVSDQMCADIMCTALEGGIGYWCFADGIRRDAAIEDGFNSFNYAAFDAYDDEDGEKLGTVDYATIRTGIQRIMQPPKVTNSETFRAVADAVHEGDAGMIDADAADAIVQIGLFNELVYG